MSDWPAKYFQPSEFACKCGFCGGRSEMDLGTVARLDRLRERFGRPIAITSGFRCERHPKEAKKAEPGAHSMGRAVDVPCSGTDAFRLIELAMELGFTGFGISQRADQPRFVHIDDAPSRESAPRPAMWSY